MPAASALAGQRRGRREMRSAKIAPTPAQLLRDIEREADQQHQLWYPTQMDADLADADHAPVIIAARCGRSGGGAPCGLLRGARRAAALGGASSPAHLGRPSPARTEAAACVAREG
eukprot:CAMPEP_0203877586 /NCGR_PEP_ID=MMETSP0359-20131031/22175_1 /ASSEMBLY_ACC=CAM_ASM_000338 /TAXON_ID=268821 /ORGANISM="Scrippsiella Hangoei, Strain SHTV-5" /LENGTH=115 /DNA_ID=CAMNT_0050796577 /DNA_START=63 /DNA_END=408 /DNA_ORIENTATION=-